ncbi:undecaprenyl-diphosphate phosphatase [Sphingomonas sp. MA1305]|uniref:undecaprenyl-diphosphate phosphatase n=1 Tax=unclassified Sphingomonas TaxID=196159 RepID=UPI0018DF7176|nr:undecaprenyl-diphosphate phosphatase [Sphingomonas sp. MA1305]MBI0475963.1 undecaprenyl-diphosphate phosphatase [Sphingomonas sp. MA1305]
MDLLTAILLGIVEGVTEFLPVSSTGHLILAGTLLGVQDKGTATFDIVIQLGAILAVIVLYWRRFWGVAIGLFAGERRAIAFVRNVVLGFLPAMAIGLVVYKAVKALLEKPTVVAVALIVGGVAILVIERLVRRVRIDSVEAMPATTALGIGVLQCLAMVPGVSRSGATIMGALTLGVDRQAAAEFSFFLAIPTMLAASGYDLLKSGATLGQGDWLAIAVGFVVSFIVALLVIRWFITVISRHGFAPFAWYRIVVGAIALIALQMR